MEQILERQKLVRDVNFATKDELSKWFETIRSYNLQRSSVAMSKLYNGWIINGHFVNLIMRILLVVGYSGILSLSDVNSILAINAKPVTRLAFTSVIPYLATEYGF